MVDRIPRRPSRNSSRRSKNTRNVDRVDTTPRSHKKKRKLKILPVIITAFIICFLVGTIVVLATVASIAKDLPQWSPEDLNTAQTSFLYDVNGDIFMELHSSQNRTSVKLEDMPQYLIDAFLGTEDARFYDHFGIDVIRVGGALFADIKSGSLSQGASTITMQLARNAILKNQDKQWTRKIKEALLAIQIERHYTKDEILYYYLNEIYFGENYYGVQSASQAFFDKDVKDITMAEAAVLVGTIRNPRLYSPLYNEENSLKVRNQVLDNLAEYKPEYKEQVELAKQEELVVKRGKVTASDYIFPWYTDYVIGETEDILQELGLDTGMVYTGGLHIYTALDPLVQSEMETAFTNENNFPSSVSDNPVQCAMVVVDAHNGGIKGMMGGREHTTKRGFNRATDMARQPGSTFKPIAVYGPAVENGYSPASVVNDIPTNFGTSSKPYTPTNYDGTWRGLVSMRTAIQYSINVPAVRFLQLIGVDTALPYMQKMGIELDKEKDSGLAVGLGGLTHGVSPLQMAAAYATFANEGIYTEPYAITRITDRNGEEIYTNQTKQEVVFSKETAYLITDMLETVVQSGTGTNAKMNRPVAGKTGTVELPDTPLFKGKTGNKDAWWAAYTPEMVGVVWMGYDEDMDDNGHAQYLRQIYGGKYPALLWKRVVTAGSVNLPVKQFTRPENIVSVKIDSKSGMLPSLLTPGEYVKTELFNKANVPTEESNIWKMVEVCPVSGQLAGAYCPQRINKVKIPWPTDSNGNEISISSKVQDIDLYISSATCSVHNSSTAAQTGKTVTVCTDPRHQGRYYLANVPAAGQTGGCPDEYREDKYFGNDYIPNTYCELSDHRITGETNNPNPDDGSGTVPEQGPIKMPTNFSASAVKTDNGYKVKLTWTDKQNNSDTLYIVEKNDNGEKVTMRTYFTDLDDSKVESGSTYTYRIQAAANGGDGDKSEWSQEITVTIP